MTKSDTPRTHAIKLDERGAAGLMLAYERLCQQLERELAALKRGEFICSKCGLRKDGEQVKADF